MRSTSKFKEVVIFLGDYIATIIFATFTLMGVIEMIFHPTLTTFLPIIDVASFWYDVTPRGIWLFATALTFILTPMAAAITSRYRLTREYYYEGCEAYEDNEEDVIAPQQEIERLIQMLRDDETLTTTESVEAIDLIKDLLWYLYKFDFFRAVATCQHCHAEESWADEEDGRVAADRIQHEDSCIYSNAQQFIESLQRKHGEVASV